MFQRRLWVVGVLLGGQVVLGGVSVASASDGYVDWAAGYSSETFLRVDFPSAAERNLISITSANHTYGYGVVAFLDGVQVCTDATACSYVWSDTEGASHVVEFGSSVPAYSWRVAGMRVRNATGNPFGSPHWSAVSKLLPFNAEDMYSVFNQIVSGLLSSYLTLVVGIILFGMLMRTLIKRVNAAQLGRGTAVHHEPDKDDYGSDSDAGEKRSED